MSSTLPILHVYEHCPFCVKARMIFGLHGIKFEKRIFLHDDDAGPSAMVGKKVVPILEENGHFIPESLDIVAHVERQNTPLLTGPTRKEIEDWLSRISAPAYRLFLPRAAAAPLPELATTSARLGFIRKKERPDHPFSSLLEQSNDDLKIVNTLLEELAALIQKPTAVNGTLSYNDLHLFAQLRNLSLIKGVFYPLEVEAYRHSLSEKAKIPLLEAISA
ncbi:glutaredoxin 2 [Neokomagataea thailandica NBRC 106555]|uniref:Glutaredoxin 2 n=2 Tax=Neokomagataea TaxID=1223423 RepID=A0A4Y6V8P8_9PROT|nr:MULTISPECIES: glutaredoxin 2 [Neokomagataea]QDH24745.1 glutaredoxin 2 [Neokomagataea tanensis]GBR53688.1 glutaredoxin 2 [Neokomagataea thailandica NBRC 106555]